MPIEGEELAWQTIRLPLQFTIRLAAVVGRALRLPYSAVNRTPIDFAIA